MSETREEFRDGVITIAPLELAATPFGFIFGAAAVEAGLTPWEAIVMSLTVFAGSAQFLAVSLWSHPAPGSGSASRCCWSTSAMC